MTKPNVAVLKTSSKPIVEDYAGIFESYGGSEL